MLNALWSTIPWSLAVKLQLLWSEAIWFLQELIAVFLADRSTGRNQSFGCYLLLFVCDVYVKPDGNIDAQYAWPQKPIFLKPAWLKEMRVAVDKRSAAGASKRMCTDTKPWQCCWLPLPVTVLLIVSDLCLLPATVASSTCQQVRYIKFGQGGLDRRGELDRVEWSWIGPASSKIQ